MKSVYVQKPAENEEKETAKQEKLDMGKKRTVYMSKPCAKWENGEKNDSRVEKV